MNPIIRHLITLIAALGAVALAVVPTAAAAESPAPPRHLAAYGLDWLDYVAPADLPPSRPAVCIVDTGLLVTPDTPADSPDGPILERRATDGGSGEPQGTADKQLHGTGMAMAAIASANGWGTIGTSSWARVVSVRAVVGGETNFRNDAYNDGIRLCRESTSRYSIAAISLSFGCNCDFASDEKALLEDALVSAHDSGISVVATAGNTPGAATATPARYPGILAVGAGSAAAGLCDYSTYDDRVDLLGPACPVDTANPLTGEPVLDSAAGASTATVVTATAIAALRTLRPDATYQQVEQWLRDGARMVDGRRVLDGEAAARLAGLGAVVDRARSRMPAPPGAPQTTTDSMPPAPPASAPETPPAGPQAQSPPAKIHRLHAPRRARAAWSHGRLVVTVARPPASVRVEAVAEYLGEFALPRRRVRRVRADARITMQLPRAPHRVLVRFVSAREFGPAPSPALTLVRTRSGHFRLR